MIAIPTLELSPPSLKDNTADTDRLINALKERLQTNRVDIDLALVKKLPHRLRQSDFCLRCVLFQDQDRWVLVAADGTSKNKPVAGIAVDLGTSRVVLRLVDLLSKKTLSESAFDNPQISVGADILARIHFAGQADGLKLLNHLIIEALNRQIVKLCGAGNLAPETVTIISLAGNTAMTHLFLGLDPKWMIREPYIPVVNRPGLQSAPGLGLTAVPEAKVMVFPNIGSYFGGDLVAGILFSGLNRAADTAILVDVGTNAEVVVGNQNWLMACAGAAGPALEGGVTKMGMMAAPGVIDRVGTDPESGDLCVHTIQDRPAKGICGSGLIDLAAQLFTAGAIDIRGKLVRARNRDRMQTHDGLDAFEVVPADQSATGSALTVTQADLDSLIRSKAAMYTILETITQAVGVDLQSLSAFYVAGTFGSLIRPASAVTIGMLPDIPIDRYVSLGNSSLKGAAMALTHPERIGDIDRIRDQITYLELNVNQDFMNRFSAARFLPHTDEGRFPSVKRQFAITR